MNINVIESMQTLSNSLLQWAPQIVGAIMVLIIGFWFVGRITALLHRTMDRRNWDDDLKPFLKILVGVFLKILVVITAAGVMGVEVTAFAVLLAGAGMAMQGTLGHFASGIMILLFKPYRVGDLVDLQGQVGHVEEI